MSTTPENPSPATTEGHTEPAGSSSETWDLVDGLISKGERLRAQPATDKQMLRLWPLWNALPNEMLPEQKFWILGGTDIRKEQEFQRYRQELRHKFPKAKIPLDQNKYHQAFAQAEQWSKHIDFIETNSQHQDRLVKQWAFAEADAHASARVAMFRAAKEIELTHPGLLQNTSPTLEQIRYLNDRFRCYHAAREESLGALEAILYKVPGIRARRPVPHLKRAIGVPHPPDDVPHYLYLARLHALGVCSPERFAKFIQEGFPKLKSTQRQRFERMKMKPRFGKEPFAALRVWIFENRPVFEHVEFQWQWIDVQAAAAERKIRCPRISLKQWAYDTKLRLKVKRGPATASDYRIKRSAPLLSPAPVFGDILKAPSV